jgi:hypothetical protein
MIWTTYPRYHGHVIRPPSEANSLILQVMYGCSHGDCTFCGSYLGKPFRVRPFNEVVEDVQKLPEGYKRDIDRVFLADGDALAIPKRRMIELLDLLRAELPSLERVSAYANAHSLLRLSQEDLVDIRNTASSCLLDWRSVTTRSWRASRADLALQIEGCRKAKAAGFAMSVTAILGIGGEGARNAVGTGACRPSIRAYRHLSLMLDRDGDDRGCAKRLRGAQPLTCCGNYGRSSRISVTHAIFRSNHATNYLQLRGTLPDDKAALLEGLDRVIEMGSQARLKPESWRAL